LEVFVQQYYNVTTQNTTVDVGYPVSARSQFVKGDVSPLFNELEATNNTSLSVVHVLL